MQQVQESHCSLPITYRWYPIVRSAKSRSCCEDQEEGHACIPLLDGSTKPLGTPVGIDPTKMCGESLKGLAVPTVDSCSCANLTKAFGSWKCWRRG